MIRLLRARARCMFGHWPQAFADLEAMEVVGRELAQVLGDLPAVDREVPVEIRSGNSKKQTKKRPI